MAAASACPNRGADSDDWEYEYDDTDTQDLYFSLDLTSHTAISAPKKGFNKLEHDLFAEESPGKKKKRIQDQETGDGTLQEQGDDDIDADEDDDDEDRLQIVGLHHDNPIVSYKGRAYTCNWASTIGTDLFFARAPDPDADDDEDQPPPLRALGTFNMLGASSTRLVATAARLRERTSAEQRDSTLDGPSRSSAVASSSQAPTGNASSLIFTRTADVPHFFVPPNATRAQKRQASFLENFAAIKARLGEKDSVRANSYMTRGGRPAADNNVQSEGEGDDMPTAGPSTPRRSRPANARQSASFLSAQHDTNDSPSANGDASPLPPASEASPSAEPAPTRSRARGRVGRPRGRRAGRPRGRGRGRRAALVDDDDPGDADASTATPAVWDDEAMVGVEGTAARRGSVGEILMQQQKQRRRRRRRSPDDGAGPDAMQE